MKYKVLIFCEKNVTIILHLRLSKGWFNLTIQSSNAYLHCIASSRIFGSYRKHPSDILLKALLLKRYLKKWSVSSNNLLHGPFFYRLSI